MPSLPTDLVRRIQDSGYYPTLVADVLDVAVAGEDVRAKLVHAETTFDETVRRHLSVIVLTGTRLIFVHADDHGGDEEHSAESHGIVTSESVALSAVRTVMITHVVPSPERYRAGRLGKELTLTIGWGAVGRIDLEPATCGDPQCEADHGYTGSLTGDDLSLRISEDAEGKDAVRDALSFARALSAATSRRSCCTLMDGPGPLATPLVDIEPFAYLAASAFDPLVGAGPMCRSTVSGRSVRCSPGWPRRWACRPVCPRSPSRRAGRPVSSSLTDSDWNYWPTPVPMLRSCPGCWTEPAWLAGCPTTTATSMGSFGTGLTPGVHGLLGYEVLDPDRGVLLNELKWDAGTDPLRWQPYPTVFGTLASAGVAVTRIGNPEFRDSGLTAAALRGGNFIGAKRLHARADAAVEVLAGHRPALAYVYWGDVDAAGHAHGWRSPEWRRALRHADRELGRLARRLPQDTLLVVTADHGMVDVPHRDRVDLAEEPALARGVRVLGGESRFAQLYCEPGAAAGVMRRMAEAFGDRAWVRIGPRRSRPVGSDRSPAATSAGSVTYWWLRPVRSRWWIRGPRRRRCSG